MKPTKVMKRSKEIAIGIQAEPMDDESLMRALLPNDERSRAGRVVPSTPRDGLPALAGAIGSPRA
jgi:hypothetical protein